MSFLYNLKNTAHKTLRNEKRLYLKTVLVHVHHCWINYTVSYKR